MHCKNKHFPFLGAGGACTAPVCPDNYRYPSCGKSTFVSKDLFSPHENGFYLNFEEPALYDFSPADFTILEEAISEFQKERGCEKKLYFDEIQVVEGWEVFVNAQLKRGNLVTITGSNASLLSCELGTRLTGRHLDYELFPFNFEEFCCLKDCGKSSESFLVYLQKGDFQSICSTKGQES